MPAPAQPDQIAALISWLASEEASNVNGALVTLMADGPRHNGLGPLAFGHQPDRNRRARSGRSVMRTATRGSRMNDWISASALTVQTHAGIFTPAQ
jgi:hypothetical protein